jgi:hypothetical protein
MKKIQQFYEIAKKNINDIKPDEIWHESDIVPTTIGWIYEGNPHKIVNKYGIRSVILEQFCCIAVIESIYDEKTNNAYIIENIGTIKWDVKKLVYEQKGDKINYIHSLYFYDNIIYFLFDKSLITYRFSVDPITGEVGNYIETK